MSITYKAVVGNKAAVTLPSVESWGTNNNILRDPPKSIMTRRRDKVNQDGSLNEMMYHSGDRFAENINVYARGVNPMVSVEYGNNTSYSSSRNGGNYGNAKLPYRIMNGGAFHPPLLSQEDLLPLSRLPRNVTFMQTNKESIDYAKSHICDMQPKEHRQIVKEKVEGFVVPTKTMKLETPVVEHYVQNYLNNEMLSQPYYTNMSLPAEHNPKFVEEKDRSRNLPVHFQTTNKNQNVNKNIQPDKEFQLELNTPFYFAQTAKSQIQQVNFSPDAELQLLQNMPLANVTSTRSQNIAGNGILDDSLMLEKNVPFHQVQNNKSQNINTPFVLNPEQLQFSENIPHYEVYNKKSQNIAGNGILNEELMLQKNLPHYTFDVNKADKRVQFQNTYDNELMFENKIPIIEMEAKKSKKIEIEISSKDFQRLQNALPVGGLEGVAQIPSFNRSMNYNANYTTNKRELAQKIMMERK